MTFTKEHLTAIRIELGKISALSDHTTETILGNLGRNVMTETWNKEQIEAALDNVDSLSETRSMFKSKVISELTKPAPVFKLNEIVIANDGTLCRATGNTHYDLDIRRPTPEEVPALALAIKQLEDINSTVFREVDGFNPDAKYFRDLVYKLGGIAQTALTGIKELL